MTKAIAFDWQLDRWHGLVDQADSSYAPRR
jgi:hypothetical protein